MTYEAKGVVKGVEITRTFPSGFRKRHIIVDVAGAGSKWPNELPFQAVKEKCEELDGFSIDDRVTVKFTPFGRSFEGKNGVQRFVDLRVVSIEKDAASAGDAPSPAGGEQSADLPF